MTSMYKTLLSFVSILNYNKKQSISDGHDSVSLENPLNLDLSHNTRSYSALEFNNMEPKYFLSQDNYPELFENRETMQESFLNIFSDKSYLNLEDKEFLIQSELKGNTWDVDESPLDINIQGLCYFEIICHKYGIANKVTKDEKTNANLSFYTLIFNSLKEKYGHDNPNFSILYLMYTKIYQIIDSIKQIIVQNNQTPNTDLLQYENDFFEELKSTFMYFGKQFEDLSRQEEILSKNPQILCNIFLNKEFEKIFQKKLSKLHDKFHSFVMKVRELSTENEEKEKKYMNQVKSIKTGNTGLDGLVERLFLSFKATDSMFNFFLKMKDFNSYNFTTFWKYNSDFAHATSDLGLDLYMAFIDIKQIPTYFKQLAQYWSRENIQFWCKYKLKYFFDKDGLLHYNKDEIAPFISKWTEKTKFELDNEIKSGSSADKLIKGFSDKITILECLIEQSSLEKEIKDTEIGKLAECRDTIDTQVAIAIESGALNINGPVNSTSNCLSYGTDPNAVPGNFSEKRDTLKSQVNPRINQAQNNSKHKINDAKKGSTALHQVNKQENKSKFSGINPSDIKSSKESPPSDPQGLSEKSSKKSGVTYICIVLFISCIIVTTIYVLFSKKKLSNFKLLRKHSNLSN